MDICYGFDSPPYVMSAVDRIIAIGDVHGDFQYLIELLKIARVIAEENNEDAQTFEYIWIGGKTHIVQLGDQIDNCRPTNFLCNEKGNIKNDRAQDAKIIDFLYDLNKKAVEKGGRVISLLGNHELLNIQGEMSYVSYENIKEFGNVQGRINAFKNTGEYGKKLICTRPAAVIIGSNLFVHAGILPEVIDIIPKLKDILNIGKETTSDSSKIDMTEFVRKSLKGEINKQELYSFAPDNSDYIKFWDTIFKGRTRLYSENNVKTIIKAINKIQEIKNILQNNITKISVSLQSGGAQLHDIEILNLFIKKWLLGGIDKKYAEEMQKIDSLFWTRILGSLQKNEISDTNKTCNSTVTPVLRTLNVRNMIVAHTPQFDMNQIGINATCVDKQSYGDQACLHKDSTYSLWRVDIGGAEAFDKFDAEYLKTSNKGQNRRPQVLEILNDKCFKILKE